MSNATIPDGTSARRAVVVAAPKKTAKKKTATKAPAPTQDAPSTPTEE